MMKKMKRKRRRSNGSDTLMFLKEKSEMMQEMKKTRNGTKEKRDRAAGQKTR